MKSIQIVILVATARLIDDNQDWPGLVSFPDPFHYNAFCACAVKRGGEGRKGSGDETRPGYPALIPGARVTQRNFARA